MRWCNKTVMGGNLIWVKLPDGNSKLAREILLEELKVLHTFHEAAKAPKTETIPVPAVVAPVKPAEPAPIVASPSSLPEVKKS